MCTGQDDQPTLDQADLRGADLSRAMIEHGSLEGARLGGARLTGSYLVHSSCKGASFIGADLERLATLGSSFAGADFRDARAFCRSPEIVAEVLGREVPGDLDALKLVGAILLGRERCYTEWRAYLAFSPAYRDLALRIFAGYPRSGCAEALKLGRLPE